MRVKPPFLYSSITSWTLLMSAPNPFSALHHKMSVLPYANQYSFSCLFQCVVLFSLPLEKTCTNGQYVQMRAPPEHSGSTPLLKPEMP